MRPIVAFIALGGCALPTVDPLEFPAEVDAAIPSDVDRSEISRDQDGCYFYTYAADLFIVKDDNGEPICLPEGE